METKWLARTFVDVYVLSRGPFGDFRSLTSDKGNGYIRHALSSGTQYLA